MRGTFTRRTATLNRNAWIIFRFFFSLFFFFTTLRLKKWNSRRVNRAENVRARRKSKLVAITDLDRRSRSFAPPIYTMNRRERGREGKERVASNSRRFPFSVRSIVRRETKVKAKEEEEYGESGKDAVLSLRKKVLILLWVSVRCGLMRTVRSQRTEKTLKR